LWFLFYEYLSWSGFSMLLSFSSLVLSFIVLKFSNFAKIYNCYYGQIKMNCVELELVFIFY
jgi:hypothetical protein